MTKMKPNLSFKAKSILLFKGKKQFEKKFKNVDALFFKDPILFRHIIVICIISSSYMAKPM